ncbi:MAG: DUF3352 domain-containing protein [Saprospiraceae bacterium]|nr:DUF3352 domain-containing protein [Saprospiraceae bacterium]
MEHSLSPRSRIAAIVLLIAALVLAVLFFVRSPAGPYHALPSQSAVVLEFNAYRKCMAMKTAGAGSFWQISLFRNVLNDVAIAEKLFGDNSQVKQALDSGKLLAGFTLNRADSLHGLFILECTDDISMPGLLTDNAAISRVFPSVYHGRSINTIITTDKESFVVTSVGKLLLFSRFSYLIEDALSQLSGSSSWWANRSFTNRPDQGNTLLHAYLRPEMMASRLGGELAKRWSLLPDLVLRNVEWVGLSWNGTSCRASVEAKGFLSEGPSWGKPAGNSTFFDILPDNTAFAARASFGSAASFFDKLADAAQPDFERFVLPWMGHETAWVVTEPFSTGMRDDQFIVCAVQDGALALQGLRDYARERGAAGHADYQTFEVFEFANPALLAPLTGPAQGFRNPCCAMIGDYVVFAATRAALELWIDKYIVSQTVSHDAGFLQLQQQLPGKNSETNLLINTEYLPLLVRQLFENAGAVVEPGDLQAFTGLGYVGLDIRPSGSDLLDVAVAMQPRAQVAESTSILWKTPLAEMAETQPYIIEDAGADGTPAILIEDARHDLYRLDAGGTIRWRRQLGKPILSAVRGIDFLNNGTTCYIFNTSDHIWLLNDEGRDVEGFPLQLLSPAINGVTVVDFDGNHKYSYFIACANGNVYGYDHFGRPLPGWNPQSGAGQVVHPVLHFSHSNKDYLAVLSKTGRLAVYARSGEERFPAVQLEGSGFGPLQTDAAARSPRIVCCNSAGKVFVCNVEGNVFSFQQGRHGQGYAHLAYTALGAEEAFDYVMLQGDKLSARGYVNGSLKPLFSLQMPVPQDTVFALLGGRAGSLNREKRQIFLTDGTGSIMPGFPLAGTTSFVLSQAFRKNGGTVLIVGDGSNVYAYKIP